MSLQDGGDGAGEKVRHTLSGDLAFPGFFVSAVRHRIYLPA